MKQERTSTPCLIITKLKLQQQQQNPYLAKRQKTSVSLSPFSLSLSFHFLLDLFRCHSISPPFQSLVITFLHPGLVPILLVKRSPQLSIEMSLDFFSERCDRVQRGNVRRTQIGEMSMTSLMKHNRSKFAQSKEH